LSNFVKGGNTDSISVAASTVTVNGETQNLLSVSGQSWKGNAPTTVTINGVDYTVITSDSGSVGSAPTGAGTNFNHAEQKLFSYIQDTYSGRQAQVSIAVQNTSTGNPGMCSGCQATSGTFATSNPGFSVKIYQGSTGVNP
jgi:filamentous hemagglutinin